MISSKNKDISKGPGVHIPPPVIYLLFFLLAIGIQKIIPLNDAILHIRRIKIIGLILLIISFAVGSAGVWRFFKSNNTVILLKRAHSLQTTGIYRFTRNPMYLGMLFAFLGLTPFWGNWWCVILVPILVLVIQHFIIRREESYLEAEFGETYLDFRKRVRRWI